MFEASNNLYRQKLPTKTKTVHCLAFDFLIKVAFNFY